MSKKKGKQSALKCNDKEELKQILKWKTAIKLGLGAKVLKQGWSNLTAEETGKIGGIVSSQINKYYNANKNK